MEETKAIVKEVEEPIEDWILRKARKVIDSDIKKLCISGSGSLKQEDLIVLTKQLKEGYMPDKKKRFIMVDMDGTLTHSAWRNHLSPSNGGSWEAFHAECYKDKPTEIVSIVSELAKEYHIVISTARPTYTLDKTIDWLAMNVDFNVLYIYSREESDEGLPSPDLKLKHIRAIQHKGYKIALFIDDRKDVCDMAEENGVVSLLVNPDKPEWGYNESDRNWNHDPKKIMEEMPEGIIIKGFIEPKTPDQILKEAGEFFKERNDEYGDAWLRHGDIMHANFPDGITLKTEKDFFLYHCLVMDVVKTTRICNAMAGGKDHPDSWKDKMVYSAMAKSQIMED